MAQHGSKTAMCDTAYGRFEEQKKRDVERAYQKMSAAEKEIFKKKMAEIDEADAGVDKESPPPTPTPVQITSNSSLKIIFHHSNAF